MPGGATLCVPPMHPAGHLSARVASRADASRPAPCWPGWWWPPSRGPSSRRAMPTIVRELGGMSAYAWVFSAFLVASTVARARVRQARRRVRAAAGLRRRDGALPRGLGCSAAPRRSFGALVAFRVVQGLGAGALQPIAMTISADLYTLEERARVQGSVHGRLGRRQRPRARHRRVARACTPRGAGCSSSTCRWASSRSRCCWRRTAIRRGQPAPPGPRCDGLSGRGDACARGLRGARREPVRRRHPRRVLGLRAALDDDAARRRRALGGRRARALLVGWALGSSFGVRVLVARGMRASVGGRLRDRARGRERPGDGGRARAADGLRDGWRSASWGSGSVRRRARRSSGRRAASRGNIAAP